MRRTSEGKEMREKKRWVGMWKNGKREEDGGERQKN